VKLKQSVSVQFFSLGSNNAKVRRASKHQKRAPISHKKKHKTETKENYALINRCCCFFPLFVCFFFRQKDLKRASAKKARRISKSAFKTPNSRKVLSFNNQEKCKKAYKKREGKTTVNLREQKREGEQRESQKQIMVYTAFNIYMKN